MATAVSDGNSEFLFFFFLQNVTIEKRNSELSRVRDGTFSSKQIICPGNMRARGVVTQFSSTGINDSIFRCRCRVLTINRAICRRSLSRIRVTFKV